MFDELLESTLGKEENQQRLDGHSFRHCPGHLSWRPDFDSVDLYRGAPEGDALHLAHRPAASSAPAPSAAGCEDVVKPVARLIQAGKLMQPRAIPKEVAVFKEDALPPDVVNNTV